MSLNDAKLCNFQVFMYICCVYARKRRTVQPCNVPPPPPSPTPLPTAECIYQRVLGQVWILNGFKRMNTCVIFTLTPAIWLNANYMPRCSTKQFGLLNYINLYIPKKTNPPYTKNNSCNEGMPRLVVPLLLKLLGNYQFPIYT